MLAALAALVAAGAACAEERDRDPGCEDCGIHPAGILDPDSPDFHARELQRRDWDFHLCAGCHGEDFTGGSAGAACTECHEDGPTACTTCHDEVPDSGAHPAHLGGGPMGRAWDCAECHEVPERWDDEGHILRGGLADPQPAEVSFGAEAARTPPFADRDGPPVYDPAIARCSEVYCHGDTLGAGGSLTRPVWTAVGAGQADCGTCHGVPPPDHASDACASCHPTGAPQHIDGVLQVGGDGEGCTGCHGSGDDPAPPRDLAGNVVTTAIGVGAHQSHLDAPRRISGPVPCAACHEVPAAVDSPGHIDSAPPAEVVLAGGGTWDRAEASCQTWCHGDDEPVWTRVGQGEVFCGSCHGVPPEGGPHTPAMQLTDCAGCHPATVDGFGNILRSGPPGAETSEHMDGDVDAL